MNSFLSSRYVPDRADFPRVPVRGVCDDRAGVQQGDAGRAAESDPPDQGPAAEESGPFLHPTRPLHPSHGGAAFAGFVFEVHGERERAVYAGPGIAGSPRRRGHLPSVVGRSYAAGGTDAAGAARAGAGNDSGTGHSGVAGGGVATAGRWGGRADGRAGRAGAATRDGRSGTTASSGRGTDGRAAAKRLSAGADGAAASSAADGGTSAAADGATAADAADAAPAHSDAAADAATRRCPTTATRRCPTPATCCSPAVAKQ